MPPQAVFVSFRLGGTDGVSIEARKWAWALQQLGFITRRIAGELPGVAEPGDVEIPGLTISPPKHAEPATPAAILDAIGDATLVVVENLCSLPLNLDAAHAVAQALDEWEGRVVFHHHDLPWQRAHLVHITEFPPRRDNSLHVTINALSREELTVRGFQAVTIYNHFNFDGPTGNRDATRQQFGFLDDDLVVLHPARAIPRKNVPAALRFVDQLSDLVDNKTVRYWLTGPDEDGYGPTLAQLLNATTVPYTIGRGGTPADAYAASDLVVFPSTWEGFGNPVLEEITRVGFEFLSVDDPAAVAERVRSPRDDVLDHNLSVAREYFDIRDLPNELRGAFASVGWTEW